MNPTYAYVCVCMRVRSCVKTKGKQTLKWKWKAIFEYDEEKSAWPTSSFQQTIIHTPSKLRVYCSIEFSSLYIWASSWKKELSSDGKMWKMLVFLSPSYTIAFLFSLWGVKSCWCGISLFSFHLVWLCGWAGMKELSLPKPSQNWIEKQSQKLLCRRPKPFCVLNFFIIFWRKLTKAFNQTRSEVETISALLNIKNFWNHCAWCLVRSTQNRYSNVNILSHGACSTTIKSRIECAARESQ